MKHKNRLTLGRIFLISMLVLFMGIFAFFVYVGMDVARGISGAPSISTGSEARYHIEGFFSKPVPKSATNLYYRHEGFQDSFIFLAMTVPPEDAWPFLESYAGKKRSSFVPLKDRSSALGLEKEREWNIQAMKNPLVFYASVRKNNHETHKTLVYDEATKRLLVKYASY